MTTEEETIYRQEVRISATPDSVFNFLVDANEMVRWIGRATTVDARPGGELMIDMNGSDIVKGEFVVVDRPKRVVFSWGYEGSADMAPGTSTVEVTLEQEGPGTLLVLTHSNLPAPRFNDHAGGWRHFLNRLLQEVSNEPAPKPPRTQPKDAP